MSADICSCEHAVGKGGWSWYTGSASWLYQAILKSFLGITFEDGDLVIQPPSPLPFREYSFTLCRGETHLSVQIRLVPDLPEPRLRLDAEEVTGNKVSCLLMAENTRSFMNNLTENLCQSETSLTAQPALPFWPRLIRILATAALALASCFCLFMRHWYELAAGLAGLASLAVIWRFLAWLCPARNCSWLDMAATLLPLQDHYGGTIFHGYYRFPGYDTLSHFCLACCWRLQASCCCSG